MIPNSKRTFDLKSLRFQGLKLQKPYEFGLRRYVNLGTDEQFSVSHKVTRIKGTYEGISGKVIKEVKTKTNNKSKQSITPIPW